MRVLVLAEPTADLVQERWARVSRLGLSRDADAVPVVTSDLDLTERRERLEVAFRDARDLLSAVASQLSTGPQVAILADQDGVILASHSDRSQVDPITRVRLIPGAHWGEGTRGTNAIGTAVAEGRAVAVVGQAHYEVRNGNIFCYATPVRDPYGALVAVLDVSGPLASHDPSIGMAVQAAGVVLERALRALAYGDRHGSALHAIERLVARAQAPELLIEASGIVRMASAAAHRELPLPNATLLTCERVFGMGFDELMRAASGRSELRFETRVGSFSVEVDPIAGTGERPLALVVHFEAEQRGRTSSVPPPPPPRRETGPLQDILGRDARLCEAKVLVERFAVTPLPVLLVAETGTGKELFARAIHGASPRKDKPFVAVNCGALSPQLIASELFGYAPHAFTGASRQGSEGRIGAAHGGTLFLDEIAEMPESLQAALLRVLDDGTYQRVGETRDRRADFRLVSATCKDLARLVEEGKFRRDLFYRIRGASIHVPPLRERSDAVWLAERILAQLAGSEAPALGDEARAFIARHPWPGNVRELKAALGYALALVPPGRAILREHLPGDDAGGYGSHGAAPATRAEIVRDVIDATLRACAGNVSEAARRLGVGRNTIYRAVKRKQG